VIALTTSEAAKRSVSQARESGHTTSTPRLARPPSALACWHGPARERFWDARKARTDAAQRAGKIAGSIYQISSPHVLSKHELHAPGGKHQRSRAGRGVHIES
jgi:hypothetical protein